MTLARLALSSLALAPLCGSAAAFDGLDPDQPLNVLVIMSDQQTVRAMSCYQNGFGGLTEPLTPHLDQLAAEGVKFDNAFCSQAQCTPSRFTLLTGQWPHNHGLRWNEVWEPRGRDTVPRVLRNAGYDTGTVGKHHFYWLDQDFRLVEDHGFNTILDMLDFRDYCFDNGEPFAWAAGNYFSMPGLPLALSAPGAGYTFNTNEFHPSGYNADRIMELLEERAGPGGDGKPFIYWYTMEGPHTPVLPSGPSDPNDWANKYQPYTDLDLPPNIDKVSTLTRLTNKQNQYSSVTDDEWREVLSYYYGFISQIDFNIGRVLTRLEELGLKDNTLVIYTADHGETASEMGFWTKGGGNYDAVVKIPLLMRLPNVLPAGKVTDELVTNVDIAPTIMELTGVPIRDEFRANFDGESLVDLMVQDAVPAGWRQEVFVEFGHPLVSSAPRALMVRTKTAKYTLDDSNGGEEEYYDLVADEWELDNLINDASPVIQAEIQTLRDSMDAWWNDANGHAPVFRVTGGQIAAPRRADDPKPCDMEMDVSRQVDPTWIENTAAVTQRVYFGLNPSNLPFFAELDGTETTFNPGTLFAGVTYYWRVDSENGNGLTPGEVWNFTTEAVGPGGPRLAQSPAPADDSVNVGLAAQLGWTPGSDALTQDIYFGPEGESVLVAFDVPTSISNFDPGPLQAGVVYEWRVDQIDGSGTSEGTVWKFATTTGGLPQRATVVHPQHMDNAAVPHDTLGLRWNAPIGAQSYNVYFGTSFPLAFVGNTTNTHFNPSLIDFGQTYYWRVDSVNGNGVTEGWTWRFTRADCANGTPVGTSYCVANVNSTGSAGTISALGSKTVSENCLELTATGLPPNQFGYFIASLTQGFVMNPGGSAGNLCVIADIGRFNLQVRNSGAGGSYSINVDMTNIPTNPAQPILEGRTWFFQSWYRDGQTSNFTDGVTITFE